MKKEIFNNYANTIAKEFHLSLDEMFARSKKRDIVDARQMLYYLCMERPMRLSYIRSFLAEHGYYIGHSTIMHGYKQAKKLIDSDPDYLNLVQKINRKYSDQ